MPCPVRPRATPSPARSPCRVAGQSATCNNPAKDVPDWWSGRRAVANQRWHKVQESFYGHRPWQVSVRLRSTTRACSTTGLLSSTLLRPSPSRRAGCTPFHCAAIIKLTFEGRWFFARQAYKPPALVRIQFFGHAVCLTAAWRKTTPCFARNHG